MSSLGIFDKETKTYKKVADLSKPAVIDSSMSSTSTNAVQNKVVKSYVDTRTTVDTGMSDNSTNPVQNKAVKSYVDGRTALDTSMSDTSTKAVQNNVVKSYVDRRTTFDTAMSDTSTNAVQNKIVKSYVDGRTELDTAMSDSSTKAVQNKVVKNYVDSKFKRKLIAIAPNDGKTSYCQLCTIKINGIHVNEPIEIKVQERGRATLSILTVLFNIVENNDPNLLSFKIFGECGDWYISKRAASTWVIYGAKNAVSGYVKVVDYNEVDGINVTWDVTGVTALPDSKTKAVWGGNVGHAVSADSASSVAWNNITGKPSTYTPSSHTHDDRYYTESEINTKLNNKANVFKYEFFSHDEYRCLGTATLRQEGDYLILHIYCGDGFNGLLAQDRTIDVHIRTSNGTEAEDGKYYTGYIESHLNGAESYNVYVVQNSLTSFTIWIGKLRYSGSSFYEVQLPNGDSWVSSTNTSKTIPTNGVALIEKKIAYTDYVDAGLNTLKKSVSDGKTTVANAITAKGVTTATDATFATMANNISKITTGVDTSDATATAAQILTGQTAYVNGSKVTGSMANRGAVSQALNAGGSYTIPAGYHNGSGKVTANSLASQTSATATAAQILTGQTAYVSGSKVTGTMADNGAKTASLNCGGSYTIPAGYHNGSGKVTANSLASQTNATATAAQILTGKTAYVSGEKVTGTMPDNGAKTASLNCGGSYAIPAGYHNGSGKVTAKSLYSQTRATATAAQILSGQTAWVNGEKVTGKLGTKTTSFTRSTRTGLSTARNSLAGARVKNYALFAGGNTGSSYSSTVDAYNSSLTRSTPTELSTARNGLAGASVGNYALFAGGYTGSNVSTVDAYDSSLARSTPTILSAVRNGLAGASVGPYALFAGGYTGSSYSSTVDAYDSSLTRSTPSSLSTARNGLAGASVGNYALFAGGNTSSANVSKVDAYNPSLTRSTPSSLSTARGDLAGARVGNYALFAGGNTGSSSSSTVDAYNSSLTRITPTELSTARGGLAGARVGDYALFAGGNTSSGRASTVDAYDSSLTRSTPTELFTARNSLAGASVGDYALFAGGFTSIRVSTVDAYEPPHVTVPSTKIYL